MELGSGVRRTGFWLLDRVRGGPIRRQYEDVRLRMSSYDTGDRLASLLAHAAKTTAFYAPYEGGDLEAFPVIGKTILKARQADFQSTAFGGTRLHRIMTSGSTGEPLTLRQDRTKRHRTVADLIYFNQMAGLSVGERLLWLRGWRYRPRSRLALLAQNVEPVDIVGMDDNVREDVIRILRRGHVDAVLGFASTLDSLARYMEARGYEPADFGLRVVISGAETLHQAVKRRLEVAFGCPVVDRYANEENGILACTAPGSERFLLNRASFRFEFLQPNRDAPQRMGELARVVVTDLYNSAVPLIRYDTGDLAIVDRTVDGMSVTMRSVEGRLIDVIYDSAGGMVSSGTISLVVAKHFDIGRFQFVQEGATSYLLRVVLGETAYTRHDFTDVLIGLLGPAARLTVEFVPDLPGEPGQKFRPVICDYVPDGEFTQE